MKKYTYLDCLAFYGIGGAHPGGLQLTKHVLSTEDVDESKSVLDAGCGTGQTSAHIMKQYLCNVTSLDSNQIMLNKARERFKSLNLPIQLKHGSTEHLPFEEELFDFVLSESVIAFTDIQLTISEFNRVLKPDGVLLAIEVVLEKSISDDKLQSILQFYGFSQLLTENEWVTYFQKFGFKHITAEEVEEQFDQNDVENAADFSLSENIDDQLPDILEKHEQLTVEYKDVLGYRTFRCSV